MDTMTFICIGVTLLLLVAIGLIIDIVLISLRSKAIIGHFDKAMNKATIAYYRKKYPLVSEEFMLKSEEEQLIENNQEIHEANKQMDSLKSSIESLKSTIERAKIAQK